MGLYPIRILVHGAPVDTHLACPFDGLTNITFPAYRNKYNASGLVQPIGPIGDRGEIEISGIVRPNWNPNPSGFHRPAPSGLERDHLYAWEFGNATSGPGAFGHDGVRNFDEVNWYQAYWTCPSGHFFIYPSGVAADMPAGFQAGMTVNNPPASWGQFE